MEKEREKVNNQAVLMLAMNMSQSSRQQNHPQKRLPIYGGCNKSFATFVKTRVNFYPYSIFFIVGLEVQKV